MNDHEFSRTATGASLVVGVISGFIPPLQATLLPQLVKEGHLTLAQLGQVAMAEAFGTVLAVTLANALLKPNNLRLYGIAAALLGLVLDLATAQLAGEAILAVRFVHGLCAGILLWLWVGFLARLDNPARIGGIYVAANSALALALTAYFSAQLLPQHGSAGGFAAVAFCFAVIVIGACFIPARYAPLGHGDGSILPDAKGWLGLFAVFAHIAGMLAMWVYIKPFGQSLGLSEQSTSLAVTVALAAQMAGGLMASVIARRVRPGALLVGVAATCVGSLLVLGSATVAVVFIAAATVFGFAGTVGSPFHLPYLIEIDPSRRSALHTMTAQLLGVAGGPALASLMVSGGGASGALLASMLLYGVGGAVIAATALRAPRSAAA
jgi:predicted MFS family arabinose efflux permease